MEDLEMAGDRGMAPENVAKPRRARARHGDDDEMLHAMPPRPATAVTPLFMNAGQTRNHAAAPAIGASADGRATTAIV
jgi:hypothetical protein